MRSIYDKETNFCSSGFNTRNRSRMGSTSFTTAKSSKVLAQFPFRLGLDLSGGTHLLYSADVSKLTASQVDDSMNALRDVIERRINLFGVGEPIVQVQTGSFGSAGDHRLSIELPGVTDISQAITMIGQTPFLEFRQQSDGPQQVTVGADGTAVIDPNGNFVPTALNGDLKSANRQLVNLL